MPHPIYRILDFELLLSGELYGPLRQRALFDPATLHDWPNCKDAFIKMASHWDLVRA
jgi:hypothetical protein